MAPPPRPLCDGAGNVFAVKLWWTDKVGTRRFVVSVRPTRDARRRPAAPAPRRAAARGMTLVELMVGHGGRPVRLLVAISMFVSTRTLNVVNGSASRG